MRENRDRIWGSGRTRSRRAPPSRPRPRRASPSNPRRAMRSPAASARPLRAHRTPPLPAVQAGRAREELSSSAAVRARASMRGGEAGRRRCPARARNVAGSAMATAAPRPPSRAASTGHRRLGCAAWGSRRAPAAPRGGRSAPSAAPRGGEPSSSATAAQSRRLGRIARRQRRAGSASLRRPGRAGSASLRRQRRAGADSSMASAPRRRATALIEHWRAEARRGGRELRAGEAEKIREEIGREKEEGDIKF